jgi:hypothetical protein
MGISVDLQKNRLTANNLKRHQSSRLLKLVRNGQINEHFGIFNLNSIKNPRVIKPWDFIF